MKKKSIWLDEKIISEHEKINSDMDVDVLIIGAGLTGISTAYHLRNSGLKVIVLDKNLIGHGVTARTTAKLTFLQENIYTKLGSRAKEYYDSQRFAIDMVREIIETNKIDCDFNIVDSYLYTDNLDDIEKIKNEEKELKRLDVSYKVHEGLPFNPNCYAISVSDTAVFHPLKYLNALVEIVRKSGIAIYENSSVNDIKKEDEKYISFVNNKKITASSVVVASHYPFFLYPYFFPLKTSIEKSYIAGVRVDDPKDYSAITVSKPTTSIRYHSDNNSKKYMIYLNGSHNICCRNNDKENFDNLLGHLSNEKLKPDYIWSNEDIMTEDNLPYIGFISDNLLIGTGYNTWGMTNGSLAGKILSDLILKNNNKFKDLFDPKRVKGFKGIIKYPLNMAYNVKSFVGNKIVKNKKWYSDKVKVTFIDGKSVGIYIDDDNKKHMVYNLCPHLKCSLIFNEVEKVWDCPCHGSRFDINGKYIFGPSREDITFKKNKK